MLGIHQKVRYVTWVAVIFAFWTTSCRSPATESELIDGYRQAACIAPLMEPKRVEPPTREWDHTVRLRNGSNVTILGFQAVSGAIIVRDGASGEEHIAARSGDYVYPADVRYNAENEVLFIKTSGLAGGITQQTWLFQYDLNTHQEVERSLVDESVMPPECSQIPEERG